MKKNDQLDELFIRWEKEYPPYLNHLKRDGINDEDLYRKQKTNANAVLFIAKEPNDICQSAGDFRKWWKEPLSFSFSQRLAEWAYGCVNDFPIYKDAVKNRDQGLQSVAFMNLKKSGAGGTSDNKALWEVIDATHRLLLEEIMIIDPDIIIGSFTYAQAWEHLFGKLNWVRSGYDIRIARWNNIRIIEYYHPSNRFPKAMNYALLEKVYKSKAFKEL